jgi:predicted nucleic acid-binding protein
MAAAFVDTNILLYAAGNAPAERAKSVIAREILRNEEISLSTQVLQEFYWVATQPHKLALTHEEAVAFIDVWKMFRVQAISVGIVEDALFLCRDFRINYWDAAIVAAARHLDCKTLFTEDLSRGTNYGGVTAVNPFLSK